MHCIVGLSGSLNLGFFFAPWVLRNHHSWHLMCWSNREIDNLINSHPITSFPALMPDSFSKHTLPASENGNIYSWAFFCWVMLLCIRRSLFRLPMLHYSRLLRLKCRLWLMKHQGAHSMAHNIKYWINGPEWSWIQRERKHYISKDVCHWRIASLVKIYIWKICDPLPVQQIYCKPSYIKLCTQSNRETDDCGKCEIYMQSLFSSHYSFDVFGFYECLFPKWGLLILSWLSINGKHTHTHTLVFHITVPRGWESHLWQFLSADTCRYVNRLADSILSLCTFTHWRTSTSGGIFYLKRSCSY